MLGLVLGAAMLAVAAGPASPEPDSYAAARDRAGRSADDQIRLALWCEARGLTRERLHHLALAVLADPKHATARGLMGLVARDGRWVRPNGDAEPARLDPALRAYQDRRTQADYTADGQWALGVWASEHGLADQARAHFTVVTRLDPSRDHAWERLGFRRSRDGRWVKPGQVAAERAEAEAKRAADRTWRIRLERIQRRLELPSQREEAEAELTTITDPRAVPMIGRVLAATEKSEPVAVRLLGQIDAPNSSRGLALIAAFGRSSAARRRATEILRRRDPREYAETLIAFLGDPIRYEVRHVGKSGEAGTLLIEGEQANARRVYTPPPVFHPGDQAGHDEAGRQVVVRDLGTIRTGVINLGPWVEAVGRGELAPIGQFVAGMTAEEVDAVAPIVRASLAERELRPTTRFTFHIGGTVVIPAGQLVIEARKSAAATEAQLQTDVELLDDHNHGVRVANGRVASVLADATGRDLPASRRDWAGWWVDRIGYASATSDWTAKPAASQAVAIGYEPPIAPGPVIPQVIGYDRMSCFAAGTLVRTAEGSRPIEAIAVGDRVLTQDVATGALHDRPVLVVHRNPPAATFRIDVAGESLVASHFHRFWVAGRGWVMARDLKVGDPIRALGGVAPVAAITPDAVQPVFNLDVADDADFFVGRLAALVHDNTLPDPRLVPFDALTSPERP